ncbi:hypothetical protein HanIR_Chr12g0566211 [Helianthus annuus]|nr:hypothetical protein HanIR_Chr12g0566211 [Helianthus annuus]
MDIKLRTSGALCCLPMSGNVCTIKERHAIRGCNVWSMYCIFALQITLFKRLPHFYRLPYLFFLFQ